MPSSCAERKTRIAISPRLAANNLRNGVIEPSWRSRSDPAMIVRAGIAICVETVGAGAVPGLEAGLIAVSRPRGPWGGEYQMTDSGFRTVRHPNYPMMPGSGIWNL